jgi:hypothetical protein
VAGYIATLEEIKAQLEEEWEGRLEAEGLPSELEELPATAGSAPEDEGPDGPLGTAAVAKVVADEAAETEVEAAAEGEEDEDPGAPSAPEDPAEEPKPADLAVVDRVRALGYAATLAEAGDPEPERIGRLADAGLAFYRAAGGATVVAMAGATEGDVRRAGERAGAEAKGARAAADERAARGVAERVAARLEHLGGAGGERELLEALLPAAPRAAIRAVLGRLAEVGVVRRFPVAGRGYVGLADAERGRIVAAVRGSARAARPAPKKGALFARGISAGAADHGPTRPALDEVVEVGGVRVEDAVRRFAHGLDPRLVEEAVLGSRRAQGFIREAAAKHLPVYCTWTEAAMVEPEVAEWRAAHAKREAENRRIARRGPNATARRLAAESRSRSHGRLAEPLSGEEAERAAWKTARAIHLRDRKTAADKILLLAQLEGGPVPASALLGRLRRSYRPELLRRSLRSLAAQGKVEVFRKGGEGEAIVEAVEPLNRRSYERALLRIIADPESGIPLPEGSRLPARAKAAARAAAKARRDEGEREAGRALRPAPVAAVAA